MSVTNEAQAVTKPEMVNLTVDGQPVSVPKGTLIIRAAEQAGIAIPRFCDHPLLAPAGACRQCLVDVATPGPDGNMRPFPKPQPSCTMTVSEGMVVGTQATSEAAGRAQAGVMELLLINHPLDCPICDKGGECPLQNQAMTSGRATSRFTDTKRTYPKPIAVTAEVLLDRERCVLCQRCTRFAAQIAGDPFIALQNRGARQQIGTFDRDLLGFAGEEDFAGAGDFPASADGEAFGSYFSGNVIQICPVGALTSADYRFRARPFDLVSVDAVAEHDASASAIRIDYRRGQVVRRLAGQDPDVNEEWLSDKDRFAYRWQQAPERITTPLIREGGELRPASWPEAINVAARALNQARPRGAGVLTGGRLSAENAYAYAKFARVALGSNDIDFRARAHSAEEAQFLAACVAGRFEDVTFADLQSAPAVLLAGFEPEEEGGIVFLRLRKASRAGTCQVFSIAPLASRGLAKLGGTLIPAPPGAEAEVLSGITAGAEAGLGTAFSALAGGIIVVGERLATVPGAYSEAVKLAERTGARLAWIPRRVGERGALEAGALPSLLPGGRQVADEAARAEVASAWGVAGLPDEPGRDTASVLAAAADGQLGAVVVAGVELGDLPDPAAAHQALSRAGFVLSLEVLPSEVTQLADVVLPVAPPDERHGTYLNWEGRWRPDPQVLVTTARTDAELLALIAREMGYPIGDGNFATLLTELQSLGQAGSFASPPAAKPGRTARPPRGSALLASWRLHLDSGRLQQGEEHLAACALAARAAISPATAKALGIGPGQTVTVAGPAGSLTLECDVKDMVDSVVWLPMNSPGAHIASQLGAAPGDTVTLTGGEAK